MAASRLPVADPVKAAVQAAMGTAAPDVWSELRLPPFASFGQATRGHEVWRELIKAGLAAPANLTRGCWLPLGRPGDGYVFYGTGGYAVMVPAAGAAATVTVYDHDGAVLHSYRGQNGECRREAEVFMFEARGWDYPFRALDRRLDGLRGRPRGTFPENQTELDQVLADDIAAGASADFELPPDVIDEARARARAANYGRGRFTALVSRTSAHRRIHLGASIEVVLARRPNTITACDVQQVVGPGVVRVQVADGPRRGLVLDLSLGEVWPWDRLVSAL